MSSRAAMRYGAARCASCKHDSNYGCWHRAGTTKKKSKKPYPKKPKKAAAKKSTRKWPKGSMHKALGVPAGKKLTIADLKRGAKKPGVIGKRAVMLLNLRGIKTGKRKK